MIVIDNIFKSFDDLTVLNGISTQFEKGKTNLIIGQSGSGKTVFLKCMLGLLQIDSGSILFDGQLLKTMDTKQRIQLRQEMGMVFQGSALFDSMTVLENILFPMRMFTQKTENEMLDRANEVIKRVNLINANDKMPDEISGGMKKRVAIGRAIVMNPKYLFCEEPNPGLEPNTAILIDELIQEITHEYNITTVINTHDMNSVLQIGEKIIFLKEGYKAWEGTKSEIFETDNEAVTHFVYSSDLLKKVREVQLNKER